MGSASSPQAAYTAALAAEALLREHPEALVCGLASGAVIVPLPAEVPLWGQAVIEGRALIDHVVPQDRQALIELWERAARENRAGDWKLRLLERPERWLRLHLFDVRELYGVVLAILIPIDEAAPEAGAGEKPPAPRPRQCTIVEDENGFVLDIDDAFTQMFGYTAADVLGQRVIEHVHPEDQGRAVEGWWQMAATHRTQQMRIRRRRKDGSWLWVDSTLHNFLNDPRRNHVLVEITDVSAEMAAQQEVKERAELLHHLIDSMSDGMLQLDGQRNVVRHNTRLLEILHCPSLDARLDAREAERQMPDEGDATGAQDAPREPDLAALMSRVAEEGARAFDVALSYVFDEGADRDVEVDVITQAGEQRRARISIRPLHGADGRVSGAIANVLDLTDSARVRAELGREATIDPLTHCHNGSSILAALAYELARDGHDEIAVAFIDLDNIEEVDDTHGHAVGDEVLAGIAGRIKQATGADDRIGRIGGDEFLLVIRGRPQPQAATDVAQRISEALAAPLATSSGEIQVRASIGVALAAGETVDAEELVGRAAEAMHRAKEQGNGQPVLAEAAHRRHTADRAWASAARAPLKERRRRADPDRGAGGGADEGEPLSRAQAEELLAGHARRHAALAALGEALVGAPDLRAFVQKAVEVVAGTLGVELCLVLKLRADEETFDDIASVGRRNTGVLPAGTGTQAGYAVSVRRPVVTEDLSTEARFDTDPLLEEGIVSGMSAVIEADRRPLGVLAAHTCHARHFSEDEVHFLVAVANLVAVAAEREGDKAGERPAALHDPVTRLPNRTLALDLLGLVLARCERERTGVALLVCDLDRFSLINNSLGHQAGDEVLLAVASRLRQAVRPSDTIARLGGDEFLVICESHQGMRSVVALAERIAMALGRPFSLAGEEHVLSASIGIALAEGADDTSASLVSNAEAAMYSAKRRGPGRYEIFDPTVRAQVLSKLRTEAELRQALERGELRVHYQPVVDTASGRPVAVEALVRWEHPARGLVPPLEFIPIAEETGLIVELGRQVLEQACTQGATWCRRYGAPLDIYVNVSGAQMRDLHFPAEVAETARRCGLSPEHLGLEVTESTLIGDTGASMAVLKELTAQHGLRLVLDDFGTGYSSLSHLQRFPLGAVKVDRSFVNGLGKKPQDAAIMKAIVEMCHALDLAVVAEGVETDAQRDAVRSLGCELVQGYLLCRPMPSEEITEFLDQRLRSRDLHGALIEISSHDGLHVHRNGRRPPGGALIDAS